MSLTDFTIAHPIEVEPSEVETRRFGYGIGRCSVPLSSTVTPAAIADEIRRSDQDITFLRYPSERVTWFDLVARRLNDHVLIHADTLAYWELIVGAGRSPGPVSGLHAAPLADGRIIGDLTTRIFSGYANHYAANPLLSAEAVADGYREWATRVSLDDSIVLFMDDLPIGLATLEKEGDLHEILLAGMVPESRGRGLYAHLLAAVESGAGDSSVSRVVISTQSHNTVVQRAWARYGFLPLTSLITVHVVKRSVWESSGSLPT